MEKPYTLNKKRGPMENPPTDRIRDAGKTTHTEERLDILERMRTKRLKSNKNFVPQNMVMVLLYTFTLYPSSTLLYYSGE